MSWYVYLIVRKNTRKKKNKKHKKKLRKHHQLRGCQTKKASLQIEYEE